MSFKSIAKEAEKLKNEKVEIELEIRFKIAPLMLYKGDKKVIKYYRSTIYPSLIFRSDGDLINTKELIKSQKINGVMTYLSVEKYYSKTELKIPILEIKNRTIYRMKIQENPLVEIVKCENEFTLEIEFDLTNYDKVQPIIDKYFCFYFPLQKPMEISSINLARKIKYLKNWGFSYKADGIHVLVLEKEKQRILLFDNGDTRSIKNKVNRKMIEPTNIYEGELMEEKILYYDCLMYKGENITKLPYLERRKYIPKKDRKELFTCENLIELNEFVENKPNYKIDGFIITSLNNYKIKYKSKFINTVDLRYKNGYLLLENEEMSERVSFNDLENDKIYEFDLNFNLIKERQDKIIANYKMPYDDNPLLKVLKGDGIPSLRVFNNKIKYEMLSKLPKSILLDIGSGKGGDFHKWISLKFKHVYCIDPFLDLRQHNKSITELICTDKEIPKFIKFDSVSILFVPWNPLFIDIIKKAKKAIVIIMDKPFNYKGENFECKVENKKIELKIKNTETATEINENLYDNVFENLTNYTIESLKFELDYGTKEEKILSSMYSYYVLIQRN